MGTVRGSSRSDLRAYCSNRALSELIKHELFLQAARRAGDWVNLGTVGGYSLLYLNSPTRANAHAMDQSMSCESTISVYLPPGVTTRDGQRRLIAKIDYSIQSAGSGEGATLTHLTGEPIVDELAMLVKESPIGLELDSPLQ